MPNFHERRSEKRRKVYLRAKASGAGAKTAIDCTIHDVSRSGCKLQSPAILQHSNNVRCGSEAAENTVINFCLLYPQLRT
ncbi:MAG: PilZ domain-containing protein [Hyphomicrobiaceae bacterium]|nr:PilZ domain-containing protein [Hyphomicrobiaceae bacterium]